MSKPSEIRIIVSAPGSNLTKLKTDSEGGKRKGEIGRRRKKEFTTNLNRRFELQ